MLVRERARRTVRVEERETHWLARGFFHAARALEVVEIRSGEARGRGVDLDAGRLEIKGEGERDRVKGRLRRRANGRVEGEWIVNRRCRGRLTVPARSARRTSFGSSDRLPNVLREAHRD